MNKNKNTIQKNKITLKAQQEQINSILASLSPSQLAKAASAASPVTKTSITKYVLYYLTGIIKRIPDNTIVMKMSPFARRILGGGVVNTLSNIRKLLVYIHALLGLSIAFDYIPWDLSLGIVGFLSAVYGIYSETFGKLLGRIYEWGASILFGKDAIPAEVAKERSSKWLPWNWKNPFSGSASQGASQGSAPEDLETLKKQIVEAERAKYEAQIAQLKAERANLVQQPNTGWMESFRQGLNI